MLDISSNYVIFQTYCLIALECSRCHPLQVTKQGAGSLGFECDSNGDYILINELILSSEEEADVGEQADEDEDDNVPEEPPYTG